MNRRLRNSVKAVLGSEYEKVVGYNPFEDDPTISVSEVAELLSGIVHDARLDGIEIQLSVSATAAIDYLLY